ncbi:barren [Pluteus cervinus]|uniref:Barren n=1 Tax=Pluteus cervinus TaxID=181527 RepID=A0ACD3BAQ2_9AGAR|nr:barren [Pluteus cervinus]
MAPSRRSRNAPENSQPLYEDDTEPDTDTEIPKAPKKHTRKRLSEARLGDNDGSFLADGGRAPLAAVNINDDAAEKRKRRKSTKINVIEDMRAGPSSEGAQDGEGESSRQAKQKQQLNSVAPPTVINVPMDVMNSNYEEWMKLATDNKINTNNTWNFALIDYFHDMSLLRNNDDNSINFQRASCTLDGCVKIYTSRVDSVGNETGKLLSNLTSDGKDDEDEEHGSDNPDGEASQKKKKLHRPTSTLAKDPSQLQTKKLDLEWNVDPLFRKTCADFDEGGAQGLLMNHLGLGVGNDSALRVVFDAGDSMRMMDVDEVVEEPEQDVDLSYLRAQYLPDLSVLEEKTIAHSLADFAFGKSTFTLDDVTMFQDSGAGQDDDDDGGFDAPGADQVEDFFVGADAVVDDFGGDMGGGDEYGDGGSPTSDRAPGPGAGAPGPYVPFDPRRAPNERDLVMAMTDGAGDGGLMDYFDQTFLKNWAGPEHWKLRKVLRKPEADPAAPAKGKKKEKKEVFKIDFTTPSEKSLKAAAEELFAPPAKGASINLASGTAKKGKKKGKEEKRDNHRLPDDMHFSSRQLVTLFLKPKFYLKMRGQRVRFNENGDGEVDEDFWAQAAAASIHPTYDSCHSDTMTAADGAIPFNTQFFHDDYDDGPGFDDGDGYDGDAGGVGVDAGEQDLLAATQGQTRRIRPETVNYAKRAKRVDVRKLKESIWQGLDIIVAPDHSEGEMDVDAPVEPTDPQEARTFDTVITGLQKSYPSEKMKEISTSFCFICLLHLANEQGLKIEGSTPIQESEGGDEDSRAKATDKQVGNIWDLKVYRDPTATRSA